MDTYLFFLINHGLQNFIFDAAMPFITDRGYILFIAIVSPLFLKDWKKGLQIFALCAAGYIAAEYSNNLLKLFFARPRPCVELEKVRLLVACYKTFSLPSGHSATSFAIASVIACLYRRAAPAAFFSATLVGFSRIYIGVHYPFDVLAGAAWGCIVGGVVVLIYKNLAGRFRALVL